MKALLYWYWVAVDQGGSGCACPENVLIRALVTDLGVGEG